MPPSAALFLALLLAPLLPTPAHADPTIRLRTTSGDIFINLTPDAAPNTVANFLRYIDNGDFIHSFFHESQQGEAGNPQTLAAGKFRWRPGNFTGITEVPQGPNIANEFNQSNARGTVAMVREPGSPDSATNSWFVNVADNGGSAPTGLDFVDGGATVFGEINSAGMEAIDRIAALPIEDRGSDFPLLPVLETSSGSLLRSQVVRIESTDEFSTVTPPASAILPLSRAITSDGVASAFATVVNSADSVAASCRMRPLTDVDATFSYRQTDPITNAPVGDTNPLLDIPASDLATLVFSFTPRGSFDSTNIEFEFSCGNGSAAAAITAGVNTFTLSASDAPTADVVAIAGTLDNNGINDIPADTNSGAFVVATSNVGSTEQLTVSANTGDADLPLSLFVCATNTITGLCLNDPAGSVTATLAAGASGSYAVFTPLTQSGSTIAFQPASNRVFVEFRGSTGELRGSTSVAVRTVE